MTRARDNRIDKLRRKVLAAPVLPHVMKEAYEWFTGFGELPDEDHIAEAVVQRALRGGEDRFLEDEHQPGPCSVRDPLFEEAVFDPEPFREVARAAIALEVARGGDVESRGFAAHYGTPVFGKVSMHVLGYPRRWVKPPYEYQGHRLLARYDVLRARINQTNPNWAEPIANAVVTFRATGVLPRDELIRDLVLAEAELDALRANYKGKDVAEAMALFDRASRSEGQERESALAAVCSMSKEGRLP